ncbi:PAS-domain containing protein [Sulfitobacter sp. F26204]|uniref:PAS-domain containing protein n=1 Tax=Sulfitobacter sp. F26204 TaxID=2996014 RepID=UPI00225E07A0|nr:PAS-domain containing protein [Sulfitobacter sp. F26204]MCX7561766.1 PAS-domain containing protein [Sulfitobacter sp. F26204]
MPLGTSETDAIHLILEGLAHVDQGVTIFDHNLKLVAWNDKFLDIYGYPKHLAFAGADFSSFIRHNAENGEYGEGQVDHLVSVRVDRALTFAEHLFERRRPNGTVIEISGTPLPSGGFVTTYTDVTETRHLQKKLQDLVSTRTRELTISEHRLNFVADEVPAGIVHLDKDMTILYANKRFARSYLKTPEEILGLHINQVLSRKTLRESSHFFEQSRRGALVDFDMRIDLPGNRTKDIRTLLRPETPSSGEVIGFYFVSVDVTRHKATMSALMRSQKMDALGRMASGISHDFNNLLTIILGNLVPLSESLPGSPLVEEYLAPAISAARRGSALTQRLLKLARREHFDPQSTDINQAIAEISDLLKSTLPKTLKITHICNEGVSNAYVDRAQLEMALLNLAMNSQDATGGSGDITITATDYQLAPQEAEFLHLAAGEYVKLTFSDDGCGMPTHQVDQIFEPFYTSKAAGTGSGLGLSMVYGFVRQSNGSIRVDSTPEKGTTFSVLLPSVQLVVSNGGDEEPAKTDDPPEPINTSEAEMPMVLLVEDDRQVRHIVRRKLAGIGYPLVEAESAAEALRLLDHIHEIGILLSDIGMPGGMDGNALASHVKTRFPAIGIVLMSGQTNFSSAEDQSIPFLRKPFEIEDLEQALNTVRTKSADMGEKRK